MSEKNTFPFSSRTPLRITFGIALVILIVFAFVPAIAVFFVSFTDLRGVTYLPTKFIGLQNYIQYFGLGHRADNLNALKNTLIFASLSTIIQITLALGIAILLNNPRLRGRNIYRAVVFMPTVLGVTVTALVWSLMFNTSGGPIQQVLLLFGKNSAFFGDQNIALYLVIFVQIWMVCGTSVIIFLSGLQAIPQELYEVSSIDGAGPWAQFRFVTLPMLSPSVTANVLLGIVNALQSYQLTYVLTGADKKGTQVLSLQVYMQAFGGRSGTTLSQSQGYAAAISMVQFVLVGVITLATLAYLRRREQK
ncbi:carbohydrate ABC transporter permease [Bifidobacterium aquikefiri]|uniref:Lipoprotein n=1 Tax=Bifidobacterium aquikefiri TaxID=1653207 RepID=A0A261GB34_9BIFI|nr:sugar ABC transporter permease [Bifidobacterium aquikefiri]OZG68385.1 lipoprotein [Bifidobacterium aquikefiri]